MRVIAMLAMSSTSSEYDVARDSSRGAQDRAERSRLNGEADWNWRESAARR